MFSYGSIWTSSDKSEEEKPCSALAPGGVGKPASSSSPLCPLHAPSTTPHFFFSSWGLVVEPGLGTWAVSSVCVHQGRAGRVQSSWYTGCTSTNVCLPVGVKQKGGLPESAVTPHSIFMHVQLSTYYYRLRFCCGQWSCRKLFYFLFFFFLTTTG